ncbi:hypothetical protein Trco_005072 [Trichoderma cornu-damae]|uniref:Uncharacterized protein n=1 Tax=Trichoderma cornu-damae TaxID=654480 RepID=A0A9P8TW47_9HYPO|nr:hypothetical protein Trco_005072 [Trichoderma cornu-damae]
MASTCHCLWRKTPSGIITAAACRSVTTAVQVFEIKEVAFSILTAISLGALFFLGSSRNAPLSLCSFHHGRPDAAEKRNNAPSSRATHLRRRRVSAKTAFLALHFEQGRVRMLGIPSRGSELDICCPGRALEPVYDAPHVNPVRRKEASNADGRRGDA